MVSFFVCHSHTHTHTYTHTHTQTPPSGPIRSIFAWQESSAACLCVGDVSIVRGMYCSPLQGWSEEQAFTLSYTHTHTRTQRQTSHKCRKQESHVLSVHRLLYLQYTLEPPTSSLLHRWSVSVTWRSSFYLQLLKCVVYSIYTCHSSWIITWIQTTEHCQEILIIYILYIYIYIYIIYIYNYYQFPNGKIKYIDILRLLLPFPTICGTVGLISSVHWMLKLVLLV